MRRPLLSPSLTLRAQSSNFWLLLRAVRTFTQHPSTFSLLPLSGALPDMKADTQRYVGLQTVYRTKARQDLALVESILGELLVSLGLSPELISKDEIETFVKHSAFLKVVRGRSLRQEAEASLLKGQVRESRSAYPFCAFSNYMVLTR